MTNMKKEHYIHKAKYVITQMHIRMQDFEGVVGDQLEAEINWGLEEKWV